MDERQHATIYRHAPDRPMDEYTGEIGGNEPKAPSNWRFSIQVATQWEKISSLPGHQTLAKLPYAAP
jgi:hypothetical protein